MITAFYAALFGIFFTVLTLRVLALRGVTPLKWLAFNNFGAQALERSVRAHGNFIEYVPMVLLMMYFAEAAELSPLRVLITGSLLLLGRVMHGICFGFMKFNMPLRFGGMVLTLLALINISVSLLIVALLPVWLIWCNETQTAQIDAHAPFQMLFGWKGATLSGCAASKQLHNPMAERPDMSGKHLRRWEFFQWDVLAEFHCRGMQNILRVHRGVVKPGAALKRQTTFKHGDVMAAVGAGKI